MMVEGLRYFGNCECAKCKIPTKEEIKKILDEANRPVSMGRKRHEKPCALPLSSNTCVYLSDGTKVVIRRGPKVKGPVWLEVVPQDVLTLQDGKKKAGK